MNSDAYSMVKKIRNSTLQQCDDIHIIPPIIIKNSLPCTLFLHIKERDLNPIKLEKSEEKHLSIFTEQDHIQADMWIEGFEKTSIWLKFVEQEFEHTFKMECSEENHTYLDV